MTARIERLLDFLPYLMSVTSNGVSSAIARRYEAASGLKIPEWRIMAVLGDAGALTQRDMVGATLMDKVAVNRACKVLEERGLATRSPNTRDGRSHHLELTAQGREMHRTVMAIALDTAQRIFSVLDQAEQDQLKRLLDRLRHSVDALDETA